MNVHLIYYAKGHYGGTDDQLSDLATIIAKWSLTPLDCLTPRDILECVYDVWLEVAKDYMKEALMREMFFGCYRGEGVQGVAEVMGTVKVLVSNIRWSDPKYLTEDKWPGFNMKVVDVEPEQVEA